APQVRYANRSWVDLLLASDDFLIGHQSIVNPLTLKIPIAHHLVAAKHLGVKFKRPVHVKNCQTEVLYALQSGTKRRVVPVSRSGAYIWTGVLGQHRTVHREGARRNPTDRGATRSAQDVPALRIK